jgi:hypothetical protein
MSLVQRKLLRGSLAFALAVGMNSLIFGATSISIVFGAVLGVAFAELVLFRNS